MGAAKTFPTSSALFASTIQPLLKQYCSRCHASNAGTPQSPYFAGTGTDQASIDAAYAAARSKINLDNPSQSRFVLRLRNEFHNCWSDCAANSAALEAKIVEFANGIPLTQVDPQLVVSKALSLYQGTVAAGGNRVETNIVAQWEFKTGMGTIAYDTSGVEPALNLNFSGDVTWVGGWGIKVGPTGKAQGSTAASKKLSDLIKPTGEYTVEAWMAPGNVVQEDAFAVSYSGGTTARNFTIAQRAYQYQVFGRASTTDANGGPALLTNDKDRDAQASLQHVVLTFDPVNGRKLYVNGTFTGDVDTKKGGSLADWDDSFAFLVGNETSTDRQWQGVARFVAIHNRALSATQVKQNFDAGVGERYFMLFNVSNLVNLPQSYMMLEASQLDSYAYQFTKPTFVNLDPAATIPSIPLKGIRIGVNGAESRVGQAYIPLNTTISTSNYTPADGQRLSNVGTIIGLEKGPEFDQFFLTFEQIASNTHAVVEPTPTPPAAGPDAPASSDVGLKVFNEINATMSQVTGVPATDTNVKATFDRVSQQLPTVEDINTFLASHQVGIAQLAIEYCNALAEDNTLRSAFWPAVNFGAAASGQRAQLIDPIVTRALGTGVGSQPDASTVSTELNDLITRLSSCTTGCGPAADRTKTIAKAACAAVIGSGTTLLQ